MRSDATALRLAILPILQNWEYYDWLVQGFGLLRLYVNAPFTGGGHEHKPKSIGRLHIWDSALRFPGVSMIHNHSWDLKSTVVCGRLVNTRFEETESEIGHPYHGRRLVTGYNTKFVEEEFITTLLNQPKEIYLPGDVYNQSAHEIHRTDAEDGTITLMARNEDVNGEANVYWPYGTEWGTARPRPATGDEIHATVFKALKVLEAEL